MKARDILRRAGKNLRQAKGRTILTSLAIGVGAFTIALAMAAGMGGRAYTEEMISTSGDAYSLTVYPKYEESSPANEGLAEYGVVVEESSVSNEMSPRDVDKISRISGVQSVNPMLTVDPEYVTRGSGHKKLVAPVSVKVDRSELKLVAGSLADNMPGSGEIVIPKTYLASFGFGDAAEAVGQTIYVNIASFQVGSVGKDFPFKIAAVDTSSDTNLYYQESVRISSTDSRAMYEFQNGKESSQRYYGVTVLVDTGADVGAVEKAVKQAGYQVYSLKDMRESLLQMVNIAQWGLTGFGALAILASIFGIINTQYISVLERTQQIGLMKALGARGRDVAKLFRYEAAWIGFLGGALGVVLAFLVTLLNPVIANVLDLEEGTSLLRMDWISSAILIASLMVVAIASGYFPARKAAKLEPIEALRAE